MNYKRICGFLIVIRNSLNSRFRDKADAFCPKNSYNTSALRHVLVNLYRGREKTDNCQQTK